MIIYDRLWKTMKEKGVSKYALIHTYGVSNATIDKLKHNRNVTTMTLSKLCTILKCDLHDIAEFVDDSE